MINENRIVPVTAVDLISLYGLILKQDSNNADLTAVQAVNPGVFEIEDGTDPLLASEPVQSCNFAEDVTAATIYFVPAYDYKGFSLNGTAVEAEGDVDPDGRTLYKAVLATGAVTITKIGF